MVHRGQYGMISVTFKAEKLIDELEALGNKQIPFAVAKTLTWLALDSQKEVRREMPHSFIIRSNRVLQGIRITPATKQTNTSVVGSIDDFMALQQTGGVKKPKRTAKNVSIPKSIRASERELIPKRKKPPALISKIRPDNEKKKNKGDMFWLKSKGETYLMSRFGKDPKDIHALYVFRKSTKVKPALNLDKITYKVVKTRSERLFSLCLSQLVD
jgi:hypothetical protein